MRPSDRPARVGDRFKDNDPRGRELEVVKIFIDPVTEERMAICRVVNRPTLMHKKRPVQSVYIATRRLGARNKRDLVLVRAAGEEMHGRGTCGEAILDHGTPETAQPATEK